MATPINSTSNGDLWHLSIEDLLAAPLPQTPRLGGAGPFVISLTSSTAPITPPKDFSVDETTHVYQVQRMEDHRMRYRLRIGPFVTEDEADAALAKVRDVYPGALTATAETEDLRAILAWQAKRDALRLAAERAQSAMRSEAVPFEIAAIPVLTTAVAKRKAPPAASAKQPAQAPGVPEVASAPQGAPPAPGLSASPGPQPPATSPPSPAAIPVTAAPPVTAAAPVAAATPVAAKTAATSAPATAAKPPGTRQPFGPAPIASDASARLQALAALNMTPISSPFAARYRAATSSKPIPRVSRPAVAPSAAAGTPVASGAPAAGADAPAVNALAARIPSASSVVASISAPPPGSAGLSPPPPASASITKPSTPAPVPLELPELPPGAWLRARSIGAVPPLTSHGAMSSFARPPAPKPPAASPKASSAHRGSSELSVPSLESTQTVRALTPIEIESADSPRWYVIQLGLSDTAFDPESLPNCDIINEYRLYSVTGFDQGRLIHALRLGFFGEEVAAAAVASYLAAYYEKPTVKRVSAAERERFAHHRLEARKDIGATGKHAVIEITNERVVRERRDTSAPVSEIGSSLTASRPGSAPTPK